MPATLLGPHRGRAGRHPVRPAGQLTTRPARATRLFDRGELARLVAALPDLLAVAHKSVEQRPTPDAFIWAAACYGLATEALSRAGRQASSRLAADRAIMLARLSGSPQHRPGITLPGVMLRHEGKHPLADQVALETADRLEATGLTRAPKLAVYGQVLRSAVRLTSPATSLLRPRAESRPGWQRRSDGRPSPRDLPPTVRGVRTPDQRPVRPSAAHGFTLSLFFDAPGNTTTRCSSPVSPSRT
ncbi:hypothetical protein [Nonomuraea sp. GTA35]|uniref:hypothetical protein n=1 Tax=Nonomuraea sp. GTA35 TaxID=1676746 RepID=UPI0035BEF904